MVVEDGLDAGETLEAHQFLAVELPIGLRELCVALVGDLSKSLIERHLNSFR